MALANSFSVWVSPGAVPSVELSGAACVPAGKFSESVVLVDWGLASSTVFPDRRGPIVPSRTACATPSGVGMNGIASGLNLNDAPPSSPAAASFGPGSSPDEVLPLAKVCSPLDATVLLKFRTELSPILIASVCSVWVASCSGRSPDVAGESTSGSYGCKCCGCCCCCCCCCCSLPC